MDYCWSRRFVFLKGKLRCRRRELFWNRSGRQKSGRQGYIRQKGSRQRAVRQKDVRAEVSDKEEMVRENAKDEKVRLCGYLTLFSCVF